MHLPKNNHGPTCFWTILACALAAPEKHDIVSSLVVPKGGRGLHWAHPVVCGGRLYLRHGDKLFAYDIRAK